MFQTRHISVLIGTKEGLGFYQEGIQEIIVRDGTEKTVFLTHSVTCAVSSHLIEVGQQAYILPGGQSAICTDHISNITTEKQFINYQAYRSSLKSEVSPQ